MKRYNPILKENESEDKSWAKGIIEDYIKKYGRNYHKIRQALLYNIVNSPYAKDVSNKRITLMWDEFNKKFPS